MQRRRARYIRDDRLVTWCKACRRVTIPTLTPATSCEIRKVPARPRWLLALPDAIQQLNALDRPLLVRRDLDLDARVGVSRARTATLMRDEAGRLQRIIGVHPQTVWTCSRWLWRSGGAVSVPGSASTFTGVVESWPWRRASGPLFKSGLANGAGLLSYWQAGFCLPCAQVP